MGGASERQSARPSLSRVLYASWQLDLIMEVLPNQGTVYIWKEQSAFCKREAREMVNFTVKKEMAHHEI